MKRSKKVQMCRNCMVNVTTYLDSLLMLTIFCCCGSIFKLMYKPRIVINHTTCRCAVVPLTAPSPQCAGMIPKAVADELKKGKPIQAEQYSSCTIYFSDIVGFTDLSNGSTAVQVRQLLAHVTSYLDVLTHNTLE